MVSDAILFDIPVYLLLARDLFGNGKCFENRTGIPLSAAEVVDFSNAWSLNKLVNEFRYVFRVNVVSHLLAFIPIHFVFRTGQVAFHQVT